MKWKSSVLSLAMIGMVSGSCSAGSYAELVTFGDSLTDGGAYSSTMVASGLPAGISYRFTTNYADGSAKIWAEYLAGNLGLTLLPNTQTGAFVNSGAGGNNYAQGGAQVAADPAAGTSPGIPAWSVKSQIDAFLAVNPRLNSAQLFVLWAGANDVLNASIVNPTASVTQAATDLISQIQRLKMAGATNIIVNGLPDIGQTPAFTNGLFGRTPQEAASITALANLFNTTLKQSLVGMNVLYVDSAKLLSTMVTDPVRFGFDATAGTTPYGVYRFQQSGGTDTSCVTSALTCVVSAADKAVANTFIFTDGIHPTDAAQAIFGQAVFGVLRAVEQHKTMLFAPAYAVRQHTFDLEPRLSSSALRPVGDQQFWTGGSVGSLRHSASQVGTSYSANTPVGSIGIDRMMSGQVLVGGALSYSSGYAKFGVGTGGYHSDLNLATLYSTVFLTPNMYVNGALQYGDLTLGNIQRTVVLGPTSVTSSGKTNGRYESARVGIGYVDSYGAWRLGPSLALTLSNTLLKGYSENDTAVSLAYGDAKYRTNVLSLQFSGKMNGDQEQWLPTFRLSADRDLNGTPMTVNVGPNQSLLATLALDKPMRSFYNVNVGVMRGAWSVATNMTAGSSFSTRGYSLSVGYQVPF